MNGTIQTLIDRTARGGTLKLDPPKREFQGPIVIRQPLTVVGQGATLWAPKGPVLSVQHSGVVLQDLNVEITGDEATLSDAEACALIVGPGLGITVNNVVVRGNVQGLDAEEGQWRYPRSVRLGVMKAEQRHTFTIRLLVPVACQLRSEITGLEVQPRDLPPGPAEVTLTVEPLKAGTRLLGFLKLRTPLLTRQIKVTGNLQPAGAQAVVGTGQCVDQPRDWDALTTNPPPVPQPAPDVAGLSSPPVSQPAAPPAPPPRPVPPPLPAQGDVLPAPVGQEIPSFDATPAAPPPGGGGTTRPRGRHRRPDPGMADAFKSTSPPIGPLVPPSPSAQERRGGSVPLNPLWGGSAPATPPDADAPQPADPQDATSEEPAAPEPASDPAPVVPEQPAQRPAPGRGRRGQASSLFLQPDAPAEPAATAEQPAEPAQAAPAEDPPAPEEPSADSGEKRKRRPRGSGGLPGLFGGGSSDS